MLGIKTSTPVIKSVPASAVKLDGKNVIIIGGTNGIGRGLARAAKAAGATVTIVGRTLRDPGLNVTFVKADLSLMGDAARIAADLPLESADFLIFTSGIVPGNTRVATDEGVEIDMATSALNRQVMLSIAETRIKASCRVFIWGFPGSKD